MEYLDDEIVLKAGESDFTLIPFGCLHADDPGFRKNLWFQCVDDLLQPRTYGIGCGDYRNLARTTYRKHIRGYMKDENSQGDLDNVIKSEMRTFYRENRFDELAKAGRILGLGKGNHHWEFKNGTNDTQFLCDLMNVPYLDNPCFIRLRVKLYDRVVLAFKILFHHGDWGGGAATIGSDINSASNRAKPFDFDIYIFSHTHRKYGVPIARLTIPEHGELRPIERDRMLLRSGCFVAGYDKKCWDGYAPQKLLPPLSLGYVKLKVYLTRQRVTHEGREAKGDHGKHGGPYTYRFEVTY